MDLAVVYILGVLLVFMVLAIITTAKGLRVYDICLQWGLIWFVIPLLLIVFVAAVIALWMEGE